MKKKIIAGVSLTIIVVIVIIVIRMFMGSGNYSSFSSEIELDESDSQVQVVLNGSMEEKVELLKSNNLTEQGLLAFCGQKEQLNIEENELLKKLLEK